jgi:hypothetical protein
VNQSEEVGATVPMMLSLSLGAPATFGAFTPSVAQDYTASTTARALATSGDAALTVSDPAATGTGYLVNGDYTLPSPLQVKASSAVGTGATFANVGGTANPTSLLTYTRALNDAAITLDFKQHVSQTDALRAGKYSKTLTFTLSTTTPYGGLLPGDQLPAPPARGNRARGRCHAGSELWRRRERRAAGDGDPHARRYRRHG